MPEKSTCQSMLEQFIESSQQPALLVNIDDYSIVTSNLLCTSLLGVSTTSLVNSNFYQQFIKSTQKLIAQDLSFFNSEFVIEQRIILAVGEVRDNFLLVFLQEKYSLNMPSRHLIKILDDLGAYVYCKDLHYNYSYSNKLVSKLFGVSNKDIIGRPDSDFFDIKTSNEIRNLSDSLVIEKGENIEHEEVNFIPNQGGYRTFLSVKKPLIGDNNKVVGLFGISTDISQYKAIEKKIRISEQKLNTILDNVAAYIYIKDINLRFTYVNKMTLDLFNYSLNDIIGNTVHELLGEVTGDEFKRLDQETLSLGKVVTGIEKLITDEGDLFYWTVKAPLYDDEGIINGIIGMSTDITEQKKLEHELEKTNHALQVKMNETTQLQATLWEHATQDPLTQLFNRRYFNELANKEIVKVKRSKEELALLLLDADYFKSINDIFGHDTGDKVLVKLAEILTEQCRSSDIICRFGGEEFVILMPCIDKDTAFNRANSIRLQYQQVITEFLKGHSSSLSIGIAMWQNDMNDLSGFTKAADQAMYLAKNSGRNRICIFDN